MTKVSTITPCYNMSKYMKGFLDNLSTQTHKDLEIVLDHNDPSDDELHVTSFTSIKIIDIANIIKQKFEMIGKNVEVKPSIDIDTVQQNSKNVASKYITNWWKPNTSLNDGIAKIFTSMKKNYD